MATRGTIAKQESDGSVRIIYTHWDGYPSNNGLILLKHYQDEAKIDALLDLGDLSVLDNDITKPEGHTFDNRVDGYCLFYGRDRGEPDTEARCYPSYIAAKEEFQEYDYLRTDGKWFVNGEELTEKLCSKD